MLAFKVPQNIFYKFGCTENALATITGRKRAFLVTDKPLVDIGFAAKITALLEKQGIEVELFFDIKPDPTLAAVHEGVHIMQIYKPDLIVALGGGSPIDAAKMMWVLYEDPTANFKDLSMRFMDMTKRICKFPSTMGQKAFFVAIPTTSGTGSEVTPFAVITDEETGKKYPLADYAITPNMAIIDPELVLSMPKKLIAASGFDVLVHAIEAYVSVLASQFSNSFAVEAIRLVFANLVESYSSEGTEGFHAKERMHYASTIAGMAFSNAFLGICHSLAHKLGARFNIPHGVANAMMLCEVIKYNSAISPTKMATTPQYKYPQSQMRYAKIADLIKVGGKTEEEKVDNLIKAINKLKKDINIPLSIKEYGISEKDFMNAIDEMSVDAFDDQCTGANPRYPLISELKEIYIKSYYGK